MEIQGLQNYFILTGTGAATLAGLLYLGLANAVGLLGDDAEKTIRMWVEPRLDDFLQAMAVSALALLPGLNFAMLGSALIALTLWRFKRLVEVRAYLKSLPKSAGLVLEDWLEMVVGPGLTYVAALLGGLGLIMGWSWAPLLIALHVLNLLVLGVKNTWSQLAWLTIERHKKESAAKKRK